MTKQAITEIWHSLLQRRSVRDYFSESFWVKGEARPDTQSWGQLPSLRFFLPQKKRAEIEAFSWAGKETGNSRSRGPVSAPD